MQQKIYLSAFLMLQNSKQNSKFSKVKIFCGVTNCSKTEEEEDGVYLAGVRFLPGVDPQVGHQLVLGIEWFPPTRAGLKEW